MAVRPHSSSPLSRKRSRLSSADYTIACICPMGVELAPLRALLDSVHDDLPTQRDHNAYTLGELGNHNVVLAVLPDIGNNSSGIAAARITEDFPSIQLVLLVGIGGGVPGDQKQDDVQLGDVVVSQPTGGMGGVIQFDRGKSYGGDCFEQTGHLNRPPPFLCATVEKLKAQHRQEGHRIELFVSDMLKRNPHMESTYAFPGREHDQLFESEYQHILGETCKFCDVSRTKYRGERQEDQVKIHYGTIGSSNCVIKSAVERDKLKHRYNLLCVEMEAAGLMDAFPCLVIRGICDYADSHKTKQWQPFAAAAAAAYAKDLLFLIPPLDTLGSQGSATLIHRQNGFMRLRKPNTPSWSDVGLPEQTMENEELRVDLDARYERLHQSLTFERMDARLLNINNALPRTCRWILKDAGYKMWMKQSNVEDHQGFLWIKGKPGSGKSTIMKDLLKTTNKQHSGDTSISYFFNARAPGLLEKSSLGMYRSLVHQLLQAYSYLRKRFVETFGSKDREPSVDEWTDAELKGFLISAVENPDCSLNIFIDALDEASESDARHLVGFLEDLSLHAFESHAPLRICLSSRHYPHISIRKGVCLVLEQQDGHKDDIDMYIRTKLVIDDEETRTENLRDRICEKSSRVFLWVVLVIPLLNQRYDHGNFAAVETLLEKIPERLDDLFADILKRNSEDLESTVCLLQWVSFAMRPLSPAELYYATKLGSSSRLNDEVAPGNAVKLYLLNSSRGLTEITNTEPPLVQFIHETVREFLIRGNGLTMIAPELAMNIEGVSHERLKSACFTYCHTYFLFEDYVLLEKRGRYKLPPECRQKTEDVRRRLPFAEYVIDHMFSHADIAEANRISQKEFLDCLDKYYLQAWVQYRNTFQRHNVRKYTKDVHLLYILAEQNLCNLVKILIRRKVDVNARGERYGNALQAASASGHENMVRLLLESRAKVDAIGGEHKYALCAAVRGKHDSITQILLRSGTLPPAEILQKLLFQTIARGYTRGVEVLIEAGVPLDCRNTRNETLLYFAADKRKLAIADLLIHEGADANEAAGSSRSPILAALRNHDEQTVQLLLEKGARLDTLLLFHGDALKDTTKKSIGKIVPLLIDKSPLNILQGLNRHVLLAAAKKNYVEVFCLLMPVANSGLVRNEYYNALRAAIKEVFNELALLMLNSTLLKNTPSVYKLELLAMMRKDDTFVSNVSELLIWEIKKVEVRSIKSSDALLVLMNEEYDQILQIIEEESAVDIVPELRTSLIRLSLLKGNEHIAMLLTKKWACGDIFLEFPENILLAAITARFETAASLIIEKGPSADTHKNYYGSALHAAIASGQEKIFESLLKKGVDVNTQGAILGSVLQAAIVNRTERIAQLLVTNGADVNIQGGYYGNALQAAAASGSEKMTELLLENGSDVNAQGGYCGSALQAAVAAKHDKIVRMLIDKEADINAQGGCYGNALQAAAAKGNVEVIRLLIVKGVDVNAQGGHFGSALQAAATSGCSEIGEILIKNGADVFAQGGYYGSAVYAAAMCGHHEVLLLLLNYGANMDAHSDGLLADALQGAVQAGHDGIIRLLIQRGVDVNAMITRGNTDAALKAAVAIGAKDLVDLSLQKGAKFDSAGYAGRDFPLQMAIKQKDKQIAQLLTQDCASKGHYLSEYLSMSEYEQLDSLLRL